MCSVPHLRRISLIEQSAKLLREGLCQGRWRGLMPGVIRLAEELGVSTHTLRAALRMTEAEGLITLSKDGRSRSVTAKAAQSERQQRIGILLYDTLAEESPHTIQFHAKLHHSLESAGFLPFFSTRTQASLRRDVGRIRDHVTKSPANAWVVSCGTREVLEWFATQDFPSIAMFGRRGEVPMASVGPDKVPAVVEATRQLIRLGHQRIVMLCPQMRCLPEPGRVERAFLAELTNHGLPVSNFNLPNWDETAEGLHARLASLFKITPPTAMIIDEVPPLIAVQQFLALRRLRVPEQVSLITTDYDTSLTLCRLVIAHINWSAESVIRRVVQWAENVSSGRMDLKQTKVSAQFIAGGTIGPAWKGRR